MVGEGGRSGGGGGAGAAVGVTDVAKGEGVGRSECRIMGGA